MEKTFTEAVKSLQALAFSYQELPFFHMCTAALAGEERARGLVQDAIERIERLSGDAMTIAQCTRSVIRETDTTRPDGAIARGFEV